jgi:hypothetical protein
VTGKATRYKCSFGRMGILDRSDCIDTDDLLLYLGIGKGFWSGRGIMIVGMNRSWFFFLVTC